MPKLNRHAFFALYEEKSNIPGVVQHQVGEVALKLPCLIYVKSLGFQGVFLFLENDTSFTRREQTSLLLTKTENTAKLIYFY